MNLGFDIRNAREGIVSVVEDEFVVVAIDVVHLSLLEIFRLRN